MNMHRLLIFILLLVSSCQQNEVEIIKFENNYTNMNTNSNPNSNTTPALNFLALGDSYTIGESVEPTERWPFQLTEILKNAGYNYSQLKIIAQTGWTTNELKAAINAQNIQQKYDLVTLLIGVNDQFRGRDVESFRIEYIDVLNMAIALADGQPENVVVVSIPDWGVSPFGNSRDREKISNEINLFNSVKKEETINLNVEFIDITEISRKALNNDLYIASDNLHFSGAMYKLWAQEIFDKYFN